MSIIRPATPGFLVCLAATILLALVVFSVPYLKFMYFLKASLNVENVNGDITFGVLGYCLTLPNGTTCSSPSVGYELNVNQLLGDNISFAQIPTVLVKWITYALVLHIVALILAAIATVFGLLAHFREMSMQYCSSFISGFAGAVTFFAFIFDLVLFFVTKSRINDVKGGSASIGIAVWLTLAAWVVLFFAGCFYGLGRCCIRNREPRDWTRKPSEPDDRYAEQMRLDAVKAEADRKARQAQGEIGLPTFQEYESRPLTSKIEDDHFVEDGDQIMPLASYGRKNSQASHPQFPGGYSQAPVGSRAVDAYYNPNAYPPTPATGQQPSLHVQGPSGYAASTYSMAAATPPGQAGLGAGSNFLGANQYGHTQQPTTATENYGHQAGGTSYYSAAPSHQRLQSTYSSSTRSSHLDNPYDSTAYMSGPAVAQPNAGSTMNPYATGRTRSPPERSYTLGGGGYGTNTVPDYATAADAQYYSPQPIQAQRTSPPPIGTNVPPPLQNSGMSPRGPRPQSGLYHSPVEEMGQSSHGPQYSDAPPVYDAATAQPPGAWGAKQ